MGAVLQTVRGGRHVGRLVALGVAALVVSGLTVLQVAGQAAALRSVPTSGAVSDGSVNALLPLDNRIYIGGQFTYIGPPTGAGVPLGRADGAPAARFPRIGPGAADLEWVFTAVSDGAGGFYVGGEFTRVGTARRWGLAHVTADGRVDPGFVANVESDSGGPAFAGSVRALALSGSTLYVGGKFDSVGGQPRNSIVAVDARTGAVSGWNPTPTAPATAGTPGGPVSVDALAVSGSTVYVTGDFGVIGGEPRRGIAALDAGSGAATGWNPDTGGGATALAVAGSTVYAAGGGIAAIDARTGAATAWKFSSANDEVWALAVSGSRLYAGGDFTRIGGVRRSVVAALNVRTGRVTGWNARASDDCLPDSSTCGGDLDVRALAVAGSTLYVGGLFTAIGGRQRGNLAALSTRTGAATAWNPRADDQVSTIAVSRSRTYVAGEFTSIGGGERNGLAALSTHTGASTAWNPTAYGDVYALAASDSTLYVGGAFTSIGGRPRHHLAALDLRTGTLTAWNPGADGVVHALAVSGSTLYVGGSFDRLGGRARNGIAALSTRTGRVRAWNPNAEDEVDALAVAGPTVYAGGQFAGIGGRSRPMLAALGAVTGEATDWHARAYNGLCDPGDDCDGVPFVAGVRALVLSGSRLYVGGFFTSIGGEHRDALAALDARSGDATAWNPDAKDSGDIPPAHPYGDHPGEVVALALSGSTVYAAGGFDRIGGRHRNGIAALNDRSGAATAWNPNRDADGGVNALALSRQRVYAGGHFTRIANGLGDAVAVFAPRTPAP